MGPRIGGAPWPPVVDRWRAAVPGRAGVLTDRAPQDHYQSIWNPGAALTACAKCALALRSGRRGPGRCQSTIRPNPESMGDAADFQDHLNLPPGPTTRRPYGEFNPRSDIYRHHRAIGNTAEVPHADPAAERAKQELLTLGGWCVIAYGMDRFVLDNIVRVEPSDAATATVIEMRISGCHKNAAELHLRDPENAVVCTGYALSSDGMWRTHSWALRREGERQAVYETTCARSMYHGVVLDPTESDAFARRVLTSAEYERFSDERGFDATVAHLIAEGERRDAIYRECMERGRARFGKGHERSAERER